MIAKTASFTFMFCSHILRRRCLPCRWKTSAWNPTIPPVIVESITGTLSQCSTQLIAVYHSDRNCWNSRTQNSWAVLETGVSKIDRISIGSICVVWLLWNYYKNLLLLFSIFIDQTAFPNHFEQNCFISYEVYGQPWFNQIAHLCCLLMPFPCTLKDIPNSTHQKALPSSCNWVYV